MSRKIVRPPGRRLVSTQPRSVRRYNEIVEQQFLLHRVPERMEAVDKLSRICGTPTPPWLKSMMIKLYQQMDETRVHAEKKCRKFMTPAAEYTPVIPMLYGRAVLCSCRQKLPALPFRMHSYLIHLLVKFDHHTSEPWRCWCSTYSGQSVYCLHSFWHSVQKELLLHYLIVPPD